MLGKDLWSQTAYLFFRRITSVLSAQIYPNAPSLLSPLEMLSKTQVQALDYRVMLMSVEIGLIKKSISQLERF